MNHVKYLAFKHWEGQQEKNIQKMLDKGLNTDKITVGRLFFKELS